MAIVKGYRHTGIICRDLLGLEVIQDFWDDSDYINKITNIVDSNVHMIKLKAEDGSVIELLDYVTHRTKQINIPVYQVGALHIAFQVYDIDNAFNELSEKGVNFLSEPVLSSEGIAKVCFCFDPDRTRIELVEML